MRDVTEQAIMTLSKEIQLAAAHAVGSATFARFYRGQIVKQLDDRLYRVAISDSLAEMPVYGDVTFKSGDRVWIISPDNSNDLNTMFILGVSGPNGQGIPGSNADHERLMQLIRECDQKLDKGAVVQVIGSSTMNVMSQKAVTELFESLKDQMPEGIQGILLGSKAYVPDTTGYISLPVATEASLGVVKSSTGLNNVTVGANGAMIVDSLDLMRVEQGDDNWLFLEGGNASGL